MEVVRETFYHSEASVSDPVSDRRAPPGYVVLYHGGPEPLVGALRPSASGWAGPGLYVAGFWKAARFAARDLDYRSRPRGFVTRLAVPRDLLRAADYEGDGSRREWALNAELDRVRVLDHAELDMSTAPQPDHVPGWRGYRVGAVIAS